ncbi:hypothetical protein SGRIM128S_09215 [Streptomyces griseomycini]
MPTAPFGSGRQQRGHPLPQVVRNKISTHPDTLPTKIDKRKTRSSTHSETISKARAVQLPSCRLGRKSSSAFNVSASL